MELLTFLIMNKAAVLGALFSVSEVLALIPGVKSNGIIHGLLTVFKGGQGPR